MRKITIIRENLEGFKLPFSDLRLEGIQFNYFDIQVENRDNLDKYFSEILFKVLEMKPEMILIPCWLGQPLHYLGVRLAMHVRLSGMGDFYEIPIVLMGVETDLEFYRNSILSRFLNSDKIFYTSFSSESIITFLVNFEWEKNSKVKIDITDNLKFFDLAPPANYQSHHSIDNELALSRWSEYLRCDDRIPEVKENLKTSLFFKYHRVLNPVRPFGTGNPYLISGKGKVLLIDDEAEKGWTDFYECFFQHSPQIKFDHNCYLKIEFKSLDQNQIVSKAIQWIKDNDPDVVMLDLRLCDADFDQDGQAKDLTGYKILKKVKEEINKGIQVIITTASNKVWNYQSTHDLGANGYIIKRGDSDVADDISNLKSKISEAISKAPFLKKVHPLINNIKSHIQLNARFDSDNEDSLRKNLNINYDVSFEMLEKAFLNSKYFNYCYLQLFLCIEEFLKIKSIFEFGDKCYLNQNIKVAEREENKWRSIIKYNDGEPTFWSIQENTEVTHITTDFKMSSVLIFLFNQINSNCHKWPEIRDLRNKKAAHPERSIVTKEKILDILKFQEYIFNKENLQDPSKDGMPDSISEDDI